MGSTATSNSSGPVSPGYKRDAPSETAVQSQLEKILASESFREAEGLRRFLRYTVEHSLHGEGDQLKEYRMGVDVFDREPSFDPRLDPVVRMAARRLRTKLQEYYQTEGVHDPILIDVPKGAYAATFIPVAASQSPANAGSVKQTRLRHLLVVLLAVGVLIATVVPVVYWKRSHRQTVTDPNQDASIAVLPFLNLTGNHDDEYLSDGLTDELTGALSRLPGLRVISRTSAFKFKGKAEDVRSIGNQLHVTSLLEGSIQKSGDRLRITVQLIRVADGYHIWSETYDRNSKDTFAVEDEIKQTIAGALRIHLARGEQPVERRRFVVAEAHELNLRGRYWLNRRTPRDLYKAAEYFNQALEKDPAYAQAYLGLAEAYAVLGANDQATPRDALPKARAAAQQALGWDSSLGETHAVFAWLTLLDQWNSQLAERELRQALALAPNYAPAHQWYGITLMVQERFSESIREFEAAQSLDPLSLVLNTDEGVVYYYSGKQDKAIQVAQQVLAYDANFADAHLLLGMAYERQREFHAALDEIQEYLRSSDRDPDALMKLGVTYAHLGDRGHALQMIAEMQRLGTGKYVSFYYIADVYAALGDREEAFRWLARALDQHSSACLLLAIDPAFEHLHSDVRFKQATVKVNLPDPR